MIDELQTKITEFIKQGNSAGDRTFKRVLCGISKMVTERRDELLAPNVAVEVNGTQMVKQLPRTNNTDEQDFRQLRRHSRRIRGDSDVERVVQKDGVGLLIATNLENKEYVRCIYGYIDKMPARFARVQPTSLAQARDGLKMV